MSPTATEGGRRRQKRRTTRKRKTQRRKRSVARRRIQKGGAECELEDYRKGANIAAWGGNMFEVEGRPELVLKEIEDYEERSQFVHDEIENAIYAGTIGLGPSVVAHKVCGVLERISLPPPTRPHHPISRYTAYVAVLVSEKVVGDGRRITTAEYEDMRTRIRSLGFASVDLNDSNFVWGTTASHPEPQWWFIDYGGSRRAL